ncbi:hypothetical protein SpiGrapes_1116 [Sphaerochaeta pleomorpha str. Grapes]|uniref:Uncharacterized protein n=1 Tax=Sphaerochaeta pleomorpha (strain ATCC BAA-1885 / DSM 22778 / Grapes) TaxID=158190 RepID=G8QS75_SPHPG|nr:hypothetical protein [Sphaerochaeta pleomorpha]AEV28936.1 hypothetical protein SpiGrapes_1116 [Sphaerochaeta pleomorpha str. Grapes]
MKNSLRVQKTIKKVLEEMRRMSPEEFQEELSHSIDGEFAQLLDKSGMFEATSDRDFSVSNILEQKEFIEVLPFATINSFLVNEGTEYITIVHPKNPILHSENRVFYNEISCEGYSVWTQKAA